MKKSDIALIIGVLLIFVISYFVSVGKKQELIDLKGEVGYTEINYEEYNELLESEDYFLLVVVRDGCSYCEKFKPVMEDVSEKLKIPVHYIDIANLEDEELEEFNNSNDYLKNNEWGTPTTLILNKEEVIASSQGYMEEKEITKFIKKYVKLDGEE